MALASSRVFMVRASWDTQQRLPCNPNFTSPRKFNKSNSNSSSTSLNKQSSRLLIDVDNLLKLNPETPQKVDLEEQAYLGYERWLPSPPKVEKPRSSHNAASLAYIGDCIYELYARRHFLTPTLNIEDYNDCVMEVVRCEAQDALLQKLSNADFLSEEERDVLRWGKNITSSKNRTKKRAGVAVYSRASSLETLIGYLYLTNPLRLEILSWFFQPINSRECSCGVVELEAKETKREEASTRPIRNSAKQYKYKGSIGRVLIEYGLDGAETSTVFN